ncbi:MAG: hypothetical protein K0R49_1496 [Burkholderiales bacterium]|jgi:hypothetical protein|nr:hypothetical protein [Burkholderiales bacterium]MCE3269244.1 hypothetical protein [Burkholderiales bacterium]
MINKYPVWKNTKGKKIACTEKIKVMQQNILEFEQIAQDLFEDGILMDIDPEQLKQYLQELVQNLHNPYNK